MVSVKESIMSDKRYYTYELIDPRTDAVFYVGKGSHYEHNKYRLRMKDHVSEARGDPKRWSNPHKCRKILEILNSGFKVEYRVEYFSDELSAYQRECELIESYGRSHKGGALTNITEGGEAGNPTKRPVDVYLPDGSYVITYPSISECASKIGLMSAHKLWLYLSNSKDDRLRTLKGFMFAYAGHPPPAPYVHVQKKQVVIMCEGVKMEFKSAAAAAKQLGKAASTVRNWCNGNVPPPAEVVCYYADSKNG